MNLDSFITFLGWATLTYSWLHINFTFADAIIQAIKNHNNAIRAEFFQELEVEVKVEVENTEQPEDKS